jgi:DNA polymerase (family 10)|tara:strand:- start:108 stop:401 length:294 start_codon:yes stop_codon:yes gene_type:complete
MRATRNENADVARVLRDIAALLKVRRDNNFKIRAYERAARSIEGLTESLEQLVREDRVKEIPGVGEAINKKIIEMVSTGRLEYYEKLKAEPTEAQNA